MSHSSTPRRRALWPRCPTCDQPRQAICPICHTAGVEFRIGYPAPTEPDAPDSQWVLICTTCDEPAPRFYRDCHACGHDFGGGVRRPRPKPNEERLNERVVYVMAGLALAFCSLMLYFWWILRR